MINKFLITGGPGIGKTTVINVLKSLGYVTFNEAARTVIQTNFSNGNKMFPWTKRDEFDDSIIKIMTSDYSKCPSNELCFFDGSAPDIIPWRRYLKLDMGKYNHLSDLFMFNKTIFIPEPWEGIYIKNQERPFSFKESVRINDTISDFYKSIGYDIITLPKQSSMKRAEQIIKFIQTTAYNKMS